jgi:hypothetical protein
MGADDYHVSVEDMERTCAEHMRKQIEARRKDRLQRYKKIEALAYRRMAEAVFGLINEEQN